MPANSVADVVVEGSPLFSLDLLITYFVFFIIASTAIYFIQHKIRKPQNVNHVKHFFIVSLLVKIGIVCVALILLAFYLIPAPKVSSTSPKLNTQEIKVTENIEIVFDRPVSRKDLEKKITPAIPGVWKFELGFYKTHFYRKLVFYPDVNFLPEVEYTVELKNIKNVSKISGSKNYLFSFTTEKIPQISAYETSGGLNETDLFGDIIVKLDKPNNDIASFEFSIEPQVPFTLTKSTDSASYIIKPQERLKQGTNYKINASRARLSKNRSGEIVFVGTKAQEVSSTFTTKQPPNIAAFSPTGDKALVNSQIDIKFTKLIDSEKVRQSIVIDPPIEGTLSQKDGTTLAILPKNLSFNTNYKITIPKGLESPDGTVTEDDIVMEFKTIGPAKLISTVSSADISSSVGVNNEIRFNFDQKIDHQSALDHFTINPPVDGTLNWEGETLILKPKENFSHDTTYTFTFAPGIKSIEGQDSQELFTTTFTTESFVLKLNVPAFLQKYTLSCEAAALRMALAFRGVLESEDNLLSHIGFDPTPKSGNIWGDPHSAFVGDVKGKQMINGYGVYWEPIERVAKIYRNAKAFTNGSIESITAELNKGHPVQVWTYSKGGRPTTWQTSNGKQIRAVSGEHSIVVKGYVGPAQNPKQIIVNDPLIGEIHLSRQEFLNRWNSLGRSGVVIL